MRRVFALPTSSLEDYGQAAGASAEAAGQMHSVTYDAGAASPPEACA